MRDFPAAAPATDEREAEQRREDEQYRTRRFGNEIGHVQGFEQSISGSARNGHAVLNAAGIPLVLRAIAMRAVSRTHAEHGAVAGARGRRYRLL